ncbi:MAG TPA: SMI1/KNR4 family protein [Candidatus Binataceae bacterium]|nr:SMI1/KNR4 family protein [Candidatus Binataceae bacterium]
MIAALGSGGHELYPVASREDIEKTQAAIGRPLPASYRTFVRTFSNGAYLYTLQEVSAVGSGNRQIAAIQNITWAAGDPDEVIPIRDGAQTRLRNLVPFGLDHNANAWCFLTDIEPESGEYRVAYFDTTGRRLYCPLPSFTEWLKVLVENQDEVIRVICDPQVLEDELNLG